MKTRTMGLLLASALMITACGGGLEEEAGEMEGMPGMEDAQDTTGMSGMTGMQDMPGMQMMDEMAAHMRAMEGVSGDTLRSLMPMHRQMAANTLAEMDRQMRAMNMASDARWNTIADSLRQDLTRMPEMSAAELQALMPAHHGRLQRLMEMHRAMMSPAPR